MKVTGIKSTGGRPPVGYTVSSGQFLTIGVKLSASQIRFLALDLKRNEVADQRIAQHEQDGESLIRILTGGLAAFIKDNRLDSRKILDNLKNYPMDQFSMQRDGNLHEK